MRHPRIALPLAALASLALASVALAGGWAQVTVSGGAVDPAAGEEASIDLSVLQHGVTPVSWPTLTVVATEHTSGAVVRAEAEARGTEGSYVATIVFPSPGEWTLTFASAELDITGSDSISVAPPITAVQPGAAVPAASRFDAMPLFLLLVAATIALAFAGRALRSRGVASDARVSVRN